jgi:signal transduction histidine kinase
LSGFHFLKSIGEDRETNWADGKGGTRILKVVTAPFYDGLLAVVQDISQIRMLESHVKQSEQLALIGQITTGIAHELKNPLAVLASSSELLKDELHQSPVSEWVSTLVHDIDEEIRRMTLIVNEFLTLARTRQEKDTPVRLDQLLNRILHLLRIKLNEAGIEVRREFADAVPVIAGKSNKLVQVFLNLLLNSMEAMPAGGRILIRLGASEQEVWVEIEDEGEGISEEHMRWLFNPFFSTKENGNGLGLSIAQDIMKEHRGRLEINSRLRKGTAVKCRFPIRMGEEIA